jgi:hypothetical protein
MDESSSWDARNGSSSSTHPSPATGSDTRGADAPTNSNHNNALTSQPPFRLSVSANSSPWIRKPLAVVHQQEDDAAAAAQSRHGGSGSSHLRRHLSVWDLIGIGVGGTVGSGIFVLTGVYYYNCRRKGFSSPCCVVAHKKSNLASSHHQARLRPSIRASSAGYHGRLPEQPPVFPDAATRSSRPTFRRPVRHTCTPMSVWANWRPFWRQRA